MNDSLSDSQALPQGTHLHEFVIECVLGSGGFGITYLARDTSLGRQVVIKENLPTQFAWRETSTGTVRPRHSSGSDTDDYQWSMQNFLREAETLASLDHPGIVRVLRKFETNGTAYFVMPFVEGVALDELIEDRQSKNKSFSEEELRGLLERMLDALGYLHERGIYHRDIKPANILITMEGIPTLIDFGSARQRLSERSMTVIESAGYTPFEQLQSRGNVGPWSDLYALGATLAKAITGETPPKAADRVMDDPWPGLSVNNRISSHYSAAFLSSIERALNPSLHDRWQNARQWQHQIESSITETPISGGNQSSANAARTSDVCHECGSKVSTEAAVCMTCGAPPVVAATHSQAFIKKQQQRLLDLRDELVASMSGRTHNGIRNSPEGLEVSRGQHQEDAASDTYDRDFALSILAGEQDALHEIEQALYRIDAGTYGICEISSNKIPRARLEAIPFARLTVDCQKKLENEYGARALQNFQQTAPPLPPVKAQSLAPQQPNHHAPHHNPDEKIVLVNSISQWPQETTNQNSKQVSFGTARYRVVCPQCKEVYRVSGKSLGTKENVKCPNKACGRSTPTKGISLVQVDGEHVVYNRIKDFFSYDGRISVADYWLSILVASPVILIARMFAGPLYPLIFFGVLHPLWIKRYHDHGMRSNWIVVQAIASVSSMLMALVMPKVLYGGETYPLLALVHGLALLASIVTGIMISFVPSKKGLNRYGPPTSNVKKVWN